MANQPLSPPPEDPAALVRAAEEYAERNFHARDDIAFLLDTCRTRNQQQLFDDLVFNAKFITNAMGILKRVGADNTDTAKLSAELGQMMEKTATILRTVVKEVPEARRARFLETYLSMTQPAMSEFLVLLSELAWVKNYLLDARRSAG